MLALLEPFFFFFDLFHAFHVRVCNLLFFFFFMSLVLKFHRSLLSLSQVLCLHELLPHLFWNRNLIILCTIQFLAFLLYPRSRFQCIVHADSFQMSKPSSAPKLYDRVITTVFVFLKKTVNFLVEAVGYLVYKGPG